MENDIYLICALFANLYVLSTWGPHMVYMGPYIYFMFIWSSVVGWVVVSGASFLTGGVFEFDLVHRRSVSVWCMLYKIRCNPSHHLYGALPLPYVLERATRGATITYRYTYVFPRCLVSQDFYSLVSISV